MPTTYTPNLGLNLPEVGAARDTWGSLLNQNSTTLDQYVSMAAPIGMIADFAGPNPPSGWLVADGRAVSRTTFSALFAAIGTYWGAGDGSSTFALPNLIGRSSVGPGNMIDQSGRGYSFSFTEVAGSVAYQILQTHLPNYAISTDVQGNHSHGGATAPGGNHTHSTDAQGQHSHGGQVQWNQTGITIYDPGHQHGYYIPSFYGGAGLQAGNNYVTSTVGAATVSNTTGASISDPGHVHGIVADGNHGHNITYSGNLQLGINADGSHQHTIYLGGSSAWFETLPPIVVVTKIIYAGTQAATMVAAADVSAPTRLADDENELALIREELAALRALFAPAGRHPRLMSAPIRGPH